MNAADTNDLKAHTEFLPPLAERQRGKMSFEGLPRGRQMGATSRSEADAI